MLAIGGTVEAIKKSVDTEVDPASSEAVTIFRDSTTRGVRAVTQADIDRLASGADDFAVSKTTITANPSKDRYFERPRWFSKLLPVLPLAFGLLYGAVLVPLSVVVAGIMTWPLPDPEFVVLVGCLIGVGEGASSGQLYKSWDSMDGWGGMLRFGVETFETVVRRRTGTEKPAETDTGEGSDL